MKLTLYILCALFSIRSYSQDHSYKQFTTADGLPSNVVYGVFQDDEGYLWFCTSAGVSRYNGISFRNFTVENGLSDNEVFAAFQTSSGRIWFRTFGNRLCYYENGKFYNGASRNWLNTEYSAIRNTYVENGNLALTYNFLDSLIYVLDENRKRIYTLNNSLGDSLIVVTGRGRDTVSKAELNVVQKDIERFFNKKTYDYINTLPNIESYVHYIRTFIHSIWDRHQTMPLHYIYHLFITIHPITRFKLHELVYEKDGSYWITHANKGVLRGKDLFDLSQDAELYLPKRNISGMLIDREGNYWFTSPTEGVFFINADGVRTYDPDDNGTEIYSVTGNENYIAFGKDNAVSFVDRKTGQRTTWLYNLLHNSSAYNRVKDLLIDSLGNCWAATDIGAASIRFANGKAVRVYPADPLPTQKDLLSGSMKCLARGANNRIYIGSHAWLYVVDPKRTWGSAHKRITAVVEISEDSLLIGSTDGLHQYNNNKLSLLQTLSGMIREHITDLEKYPQNAVCAATNGAGLVLLKNNRKFIINAAAEAAPNKRLLSDICRKLFIDRASRIWVCTNTGLNKVTINSWAPFEYEVEEFTTDDALISNDVNDVFVSDDTVWVATSGGLSYFRQSHVKRRGKLPLIYISSADTLQNQSFSYGHKIAIGLEGISYESLGKIRYRYRMKGLHTDWQITDRHQLLYEVLPPGQYELQVYGVNRFGQESEKPATVIFTVVPPWWKTNLAYALYFLIFVALLIAGLLLARRSIKRKERARMKHEQQLHQLELKALRSQMNPHFIFNTLNAVQKYILENDKEASYRYLTRFSRLIRGFLENSRQTFISLQHELDLLRSYMEMETLRFRNKFTYEIEIDPSLDPASVFIPSMLIQPYVENAIWHGIQHKEANGFVKLSVKDQGNNVLKCRIEDNGIGRKKAGQIEFASGHQHQPVGMTITRQRLELINQRLKQTVSVKYIDLADEEPGGSGTIVELVITYLTKKP